MYSRRKLEKEWNKFFYILKLAFVYKHSSHLRSWLRFTSLMEHLWWWTVLRVSVWWEGLMWTRIVRWTWWKKRRKVKVRKLKASLSIFSVWLLCRSVSVCMRGHKVEFMIDKRVWLDIIIIFLFLPPSIPTDIAFASPLSYIFFFINVMINFC